MLAMHGGPYDRVAQERALSASQPVVPTGGRASARRSVVQTESPFASRENRMNLPVARLPTEDVPHRLSP